MIPSLHCLSFILFTTPYPFHFVLFLFFSTIYVQHNFKLLIFIGLHWNVFMTILDKFPFCPDFLLFFCCYSLLLVTDFRPHFQNT